VRASRSVAALAGLPRCAACDLAYAGAARSTSRVLIDNQDPANEMSSNKQACACGVWSRSGPVRNRDPLMCAPFSVRYADRDRKDALVVGSADVIFIRSRRQLDRA
jgi:hypothetical protein